MGGFLSRVPTTDLRAGSGSMVVGACWLRLLLVPIYSVDDAFHSLFGWKAFGLPA